jgi:hypothetical protein
MLHSLCVLPGQAGRAGWVESAPLLLYPIREEKVEQNMGHFPDFSGSHLLLPLKTIETPQ